MAEPQPPRVHEGATGEIEDEATSGKPKSAEDRKAAAAMSAMDASAADDEAKSAKNVDADAVRKAMDRLAGVSGAAASEVKKKDEVKEVKKAVKVDAADVTLVVEELELSKTKATELLRAYDGDVVKALKAYVTPVF